MFRRSGDVLDLTDLQRRGLLKVKEKKAESGIKVNAQGYFEFGGNLKSSEGIEPTPPSSVMPEPPSLFSTDPGALIGASNSGYGASGDSGAGALSSASNLGYGMTGDSGASALGFLDSLAAASTTTSASSAVDSLEIQGLKNKIDDLEYKLERLMEKIAKLESST